MAAEILQSLHAAVNELNNSRKRVYSPIPLEEVKIKSHTFFFFLFSSVIFFLCVVFVFHCSRTAAMAPNGHELMQN